MFTTVHNFILKGGLYHLGFALFACANARAYTHTRTSRGMKVINLSWGQRSLSMCVLNKSTKISLTWAHKWNQSTGRAHRHHAPLDPQRWHWQSGHTRARTLSAIYPLNTVTTINCSQVETPMRTTSRSASLRRFVAQSRTSWLYKPTVAAASRVAVPDDLGSEHVGRGAPG